MNNNLGRSNCQSGPLERAKVCRTPTILRYSQYQVVTSNIAIQKSGQFLDDSPRTTRMDCLDYHPLATVKMCPLGVGTRLDLGSLGPTPTRPPSADQHCSLLAACHGGEKSDGHSGGIIFLSSSTDLQAIVQSICPKSDVISQNHHLTISASSYPHEMWTNIKYLVGQTGFIIAKKIEPGMVQWNTVYHQTPVVYHHLLHQNSQYIWVNYNNSLIWIKAIWGYFPLPIMIPVREDSEVVIIYPYIYI